MLTLPHILQWLLGWALLKGSEGAQLLYIGLMYCSLLASKSVSTRHYWALGKVHVHLIVLLLDQSEYHVVCGVVTFEMLDHKLSLYQHNVIILRVGFFFLHYVLHRN